MAFYYDVENTRNVCELISRNNGVVYTHAGSIHLDDVSACAVASILYGSGVKFSRTDDKYLKEQNLNDDNALILDIGGGKYDHHFDSTESEKIRYYDNLVVFASSSDKIQMSAVARFWEDIGTNTVHEFVLRCGKEPNDEWCHNVATSIEKNLIVGISLTDTTGQAKNPNLLSANVSRRCAAAQIFHKDLNKLFEELVSEMKEMIEAYIVTEYKALEDAAAVTSLAWSASDKGHPTWVNLSDENHDHIAANQFKETVIRFIVEPSNRTIGEWNVNAVDSVNCPILDSVKEIDGFKYLHDKKFLAVFTSKEAAEKAASVCSANLDIW